ncbi:DUF4321 domain-containing protein [Herbinix luporum]|jgi:ACR3 family arsenite efflux pump ArsB|uniref:Putative membrane protein n=1 Tax=Herbinix luporum TaxID=1679721 RepID=A0A0K8J5F2_9FIRM|nr:DUF4321 domain-containing protein [Herbinix luporum]MDI9488456.1 DUF4321 domain-containing protein [Bacillota bacterium]CUH92687.1 putative membrane protein [Herbinix luporum]HHT56675.1 DUF4321 domain-containing protein [Herbinix luporum]
MAKTIGKNKWALFLLVLLGILIGSFIAHLVKNVEWLSWLNYGMEFAIGDTGKGNVVSLNLGALVIYFGIKIKITVASALGALISVIIYKKI